MSIGKIDFPGFDASWFYCGAFFKYFIEVFAAHVCQIYEIASRKQGYRSSVQKLVQLGASHSLAFFFKSVGIAAVSWK